MADSNMQNVKTEPTASQAVKNDNKTGSVASNAHQISPQTSQSGPIEKEKPAKDQLQENIAHHRSALYYGPPDPNARFWGIIATSRRNRSVNRVSRKLQRSKCERKRKAELGTRFVDNEMRKANGLGDVCSRGKFGEPGYGSEPSNPAESDITPTSSRYNAGTVVEVYELLLASCAKVLARFRAKRRKERIM
ncbi:uncharacterized protein EAE97_002233 [Botrytis byssoidea]|uniref:Uncharacterized protein n=1 Tax=Botrytis byssoidea TaxID=139641 RepID=A0A9P5IXL3_9HELO|nr:uncharacterized protein EAE97_002233 [Botrytis byssoidea]KAF7950681.1 hypothetical protein EAE97_002233 [Botrytis byssoidea]